MSFGKAMVNADPGNGYDSLPCIALDLANEVSEIELPEESIDSGLTDDRSEDGLMEEEATRASFTPAAPISDYVAAHAGQMLKGQLKTILALLLLLFAMLMNDVSLALVHERVPETNPLPDFWFDVFPELPRAIKLTEVLMLAVILCALVVAVLHQNRWVVLRRVFLITSLAYMGRAFTICIIQIPVPSRNTFCSPKMENVTTEVIVRRVFWIFSGFGMDIVHNRVLCGDLVYSGHTIAFVMAYLTVRQYAKPRWINLRHLVSTAAAIGIVGILMARKHYTLDIVMAYYVTTSIFWIYHTLVECQNLNLNSRSISISNVIWYPLFEYFESLT